MREIVLVLPDIRSTHNTGSFFRTGDAVGVSKIYLSGITAPPPHPHLIKVSLGAEEVVPWEYKENVFDVIALLKSDGYELIAVEQTAKSVPYTKASYSDKVAIFFGNEVEGLSSEILSCMDQSIMIPMHGKKESLNVSVAGGIILYELVR